MGFIWLFLLVIPLTILGMICGIVSGARFAFFGDSIVDIISDAWLYGPFSKINVRLLHRPLVVHSQQSQLLVRSTNRVVSQPCKYTVALIGYVKASSSMEFVDKIKTVRVVARGIGFDKAFEEVFDVGRSDVEFASEVMVIS
jgi:hypothetical protein